MNVRIMHDVRVRSGYTSVAVQQRWEWGGTGWLGPTQQDAMRRMSRHDSRRAEEASRVHDIHDVYIGHVGDAKQGFTHGMRHT